MRVNADFTARVVIRPQDYHWTPSPSGGVDRMMLDRVGDEVARATTIVRFAPGSRFASHRHGGGEEFLVLDGVFSDETGDFPAGAYVRNPIGTSHAPHTDPGCTIFVKLHQFSPSDTEAKHIDTRNAAYLPGPVEGIAVLPLHEVPAETVTMIRFGPGAAAPARTDPGGQEILVIEGALHDEAGDYPAGTWVRNPPGSSAALRSEAGCLLYMKTGHLSR